MPVLFRTSRRVEFVDTDTAQIVHFSNFFRWMESAEVEMLRSLGLSVKMEWEGRSLGFPRVSASCDYIRPVRFEDVLDIAVTVKKLGRTSVTYGFDFTHKGEPVARGQVTAVCCLVHPNRLLEPVEIPESVRRLLTSDS